MLLLQNTSVNSIYIVIVLIELILNKMDTITLSAFSMKWDICNN